MSYAIHVNWSEYDEKWDNIGRSLMETSCKHKEGVSYSGYCEKCEIYEDSYYPMINYAYKLETTPDDNNVVEVCNKTNCTVMYNNEEDCYYLALCGGGMDLSQDIALAYTILEKWIPLDLALNVSTQDGLSTYGKTFRKVMRACRDSIRKDINNGKWQIKRINESLKESRLKEKATV